MVLFDIWMGYMLLYYSAVGNMNGSLLFLVSMGGGGGGKLDK